MGPRWTGLPAIAMWAVAWLALLFSLAGAMSIGVFVLPIAAVLLFVAGARARLWPEVLGGLLGIGILALYLGLGNLGYKPCSPGPVILAPGESDRCGGLPPLPFLATGVLFLLGGIVSLRLLRKPSGTKPA